MDGKTRGIIALSIVMIFMGVQLGVLPVKAIVIPNDPPMTIIGPDYVSPGGPIEISPGGFDCTGASLFFFLSLNGDSEISSGDIYFARKSAVDVLGQESITLLLPKTIDAGEYYVKATDIKMVGKYAVVSDDSIEVVRDHTVVVLQRNSGIRSSTISILIRNAGGYDYARVFLNDFSNELGSVDVVNGRASFEYNSPDILDGELLIILRDAVTQETLGKLTTN